MAILRGQQPIRRPVPFTPRPPGPVAPKMGPYPIGAAMRVAREHAKAFPLERYYQVAARVAGIVVSIQSDTFEGDFWAEYRHDHERAANYETLVRWLSDKDQQMVADGLLERGVGDQDVWWVIPFPRVPDMATRIE